MTPDQIKKTAIEAAMLEAAESGCPIQWHAMRDAIAAYEAAMNQQPENAPIDELVLARRRDYIVSPNLWIVARRINSHGEWQCIYGTRYHDRELICFRPLPQPPEEK